MAGYKLVLVPMSQVRALSRGIPQQAVITGGTYEVVGDVSEDRKISASRRLFGMLEPPPWPGARRQWATERAAESARTGNRSTLGGEWAP